MHSDVSQESGNVMMDGATDKAMYVPVMILLLVAAPDSGQASRSRLHKAEYDQ